MDETTFRCYAEKSHVLLEKLEQAAVVLHKEVHQMYGVGLDYGFHLEMAANYVRKYGHFVASGEADLLVLYAAVYFHDAIEDARVSYNNLVAIFLDLGLDRHSSVSAADVVYALTNLRGKTRAERASDEYYRLIRETPFASFVKMCDRLANVAYSTRFGLSDRMAGVYRDENVHFVQAVCEQTVTPVPEAMITELNLMLGL